MPCCAWCAATASPRVDATCATALAHEMLNIKRLETMLKHPAAPAPAVPVRTLAPARYLRDPRQYVLSCVAPDDHDPPLAVSITAPHGESR